MAAYPRRDVAGLHGDDWLAFLDQAQGGKAFREGPASVVATAPYAPVPAAPEVTVAVREWVRRHHPLDEPA